MKKAPAKVTSKGRVTIPSHIRDELEIDIGDYVLIGVEPLDDKDYIPNPYSHAADVEKLKEDG